MSISRMAHTHCNRTLKSDKKHVQVCSFFLGVLYHSLHVNLLMPEYVCPILLFARSLARFSLPFFEMLQMHIKALPYIMQQTVC